MMSDQDNKNFGWVSIQPTEAHSYIVPNIINFLPSSNNIRILDAGCGNGYLSGVLAKSGYDVVGIDQALDGIRIAEKNYPTVRFQRNSVYDNLQDIASDVDIIISSEVIEHLYYPKQFLLNMYSILRPGGYIILTTPYHGYIKNLILSLFNLWDNHHTSMKEGGHIKFFSQNTLCEILIDTGFVNCEFNNAGRVKYLWKSIVCRARKPETTGNHE